MASARWRLGGRLDRAQRVVVVADRQPEDRDDRVADDLLDRAAVRLEDRAHLIEVEGQDLAQRLRIEALAERGRALQVGVDDRREAADLGRPPARPREACRTTRTRRYRSGIVAPQVEQVVAPIGLSLAAAARSPPPVRRRGAAANVR